MATNLLPSSGFLHEDKDILHFHIYHGKKVKAKLSGVQDFWLIKQCMHVCKRACVCACVCDSERDKRTERGRREEHQTVWRGWWVSLSPAKLKLTLLRCGCYNHILRLFFTNRLHHCLGAPGQPASFFSCVHLIKKQKLGKRILRVRRMKRKPLGKHLFLILG